MKKIIYLIIGIILFAGCEKDLLDKYPVDTLNPSIFWQTEQDAVAAVNDLYTQLPSFSNWIDREILTDFAVGSYASNDLNDITEGTADSGAGIFKRWWGNGYDGIAACNLFLENIEQVPDLEQSLKNRMKAEARFIRSYIYLIMVMDFGDVPLLTKTVTVSEGAEVTRTNRFEVFDFIISEMDVITTVLPTRSDYISKDNELGRATSGAALALKCRTALFAGSLAQNFGGNDAESYFEKAVSSSEKIINSGEYGLYPDYNDLFSYEAELSKEIILARNYAKDILPYAFYTNYAPRELSGGPGVNLSVTQNLVDLYQIKESGMGVEKTGSGYDPTDPYLGRDPRMEASIFFSAYDNDSHASIINNKRWDVRPGLPADLQSADVLNKDNGDTKTGFIIKKYINEEDAGQGGNDGTNLILIRYADVLLMNAEAHIELNQNLNIALQRINMVRQRGGMPLLSESGYNSSDLTNQQIMREIVRRERNVELALEGLRLFDIRRWKIAENVIDGPVRGMSYIDYKTGDLVNFTWGVAQRIFDPERDYLFAIPVSERIINPNLEQNPGY